MLQRFTMTTELAANCRGVQWKKFEGHCKPQHQLSVMMLVLPDQLERLVELIPSGDSKREPLLRTRSKVRVAQGEVLGQAPSSYLKPCIVNSVVINTLREISLIT